MTWTETELERRAEAEAGKAVVANLKTDRFLVTWAKERGLYRYIGRASRWMTASKWKNPYRIGPDGDRAEVCRKYEAAFRLQDQVAELKGKVLCCYCWPEQCHGDFLADLANAQP
jgi:hypothetical protein